ncbi:MAG: hypothetical protein KJ941_10855 [Bacteroidetes bacterium]|nr:hypothetical protein [Bacteroidota bacterium]
MKPLNFILFILLFQHSIGQVVIDLTSPEIIKENKVYSCKELWDSKDGPTVFFDSLGYPIYHTFSASVLDSSYQLTDGFFGKKTFEFDESGNLIKTTVLQPVLIDSFEIYRELNYYYLDTILVKEVSRTFNPNESFSIIYDYSNSTLKSSKFFKLKDSITLSTIYDGIKHFYYDSIGQLKSTHSEGEYYGNYSSQYSYYGDTTWVKTEDISNPDKEEIQYCKMKNNGRLTELITTRKYSTYREKFIYNDNGLLIKIQGFTDNGDMKNERLFEYKFIE